jgi:heat shock protein HslJ
MNKFMMALVGVAVCIPAVVSANSPDPQYVKLGQYSQDLHMAPSLDSDQISVLAANTENIYNFGCLINGDDNVTFDNENSSSAPLNNDTWCLVSVRQNAGWAPSSVLEISEKTTQSFDGKLLTGLAGSEWLVTNGDPSSQVVKDQTIRFGSDQKISGNSGCNRFSGKFTIQDDQLKIGPLMVTRMFCNADLMQTENAFLKLMAEVKFFKANHMTLVLMDEEMSILLTLKRTDFD